MALLLVLGTGQGLFADSADFIVLLDTSESVFPIFDDLVHFIIEDTMRSHLQKGDTFHLLSFADTPSFEVSTTIRSSEDISTVLQQVFLLHPLGSYTDLLHALDFLDRYIEDLEQNSKKYVIILTDGIHDPPPGSRYNLPDAELSSELSRLTENLKSRDPDLRLVQLPLPPDSGGTETMSDSGIETASGTDTVSGPETGSGEEITDTGFNILEELSGELETEIIEYPDEQNGDSLNEVLGTPSISTPDNLSIVESHSIIPISVRNHDKEPKKVELLGLYLGDENILVNRPEAFIEPGEEAVLEAEIRLPDSFSGDESELTLLPVFSDNIRFNPAEIRLNVQPHPEKVDDRILKNWHILLIIAGAVIIGLILFLLIRKIRASFDVLHQKGSSKIRRKIVEGKKIELVVKGQNTQIGLRNVHFLGEGDKSCVGGSNSPFIIFLYTFPRCIGEVGYRNGKLYFRPKREDFFQPEHLGLFEDCLGQLITAANKNGKIIEFLFREYISPLDKINKIMRLTREPGYTGPPELPSF